MVLYNTIGQGYNTTRRADPYIAGRLYELLCPEDGGLYLDIGCGTGNYFKALSEKGLQLYGVDPSATMLEAARKKNPSAVFIEAQAEQIPLADAFFDGAIAVLTIHHWSDMLKGLAEVKRLLKPGSKMVMFSFTPEQVGQYWLRHYFPQMIERGMRATPARADMERLFTEAGFSSVQTENYFVQPELEDLFMYAGKHDPERYLDAEFRSGVSAFRMLIDEDELETGLSRLVIDMKTGAINDIIQQYENETGDYIFFVATV